MGSKKRNETIDLVKGIGIILMVMRHARAPYSDFFLLFHMAIFFIASGYLYNSVYAKNIKFVTYYTIRKIKSLYLPYLLFTVAFILLNNIFLNINVYTDNADFIKSNMLEPGYASLGTYYTIIDQLKMILKAVFFRAGTQIGGAFWFFQVMYMVMVGYNIAEFCILKITQNENKRIILQTLFSGVLLMLGYWCQLFSRNLMGLNRVCSVYILVHLGVLIKHFTLMEKVRRRVKAWVTIVLSFFVLLLGYHRGYIALDRNNIENPIFYIVMSISGWFLIYSVSEILIGRKCKINHIMEYVSIHSIPIIALHFLCFKIVNLFAVIVHGMHGYMVAAFPVLMHGGLWWFLYTMIGISIPLLIRKNIYALKESIKRIMV